MAHENGRPGEGGRNSTQPTTATTSVTDPADTNAALVAILGPLVSDLIADLNAAREQLTQAYRDGVADGIAQGMRLGAEQAEQDMAASWARVADQVRRSGSPRSQAYAERHRAELEAAKPRPGDYTGHLTAAQYLGTPTRRSDLGASA